VKIPEPSSHARRTLVACGWARDKVHVWGKRGCRDAIDAEDQMPIVLDDLHLRVVPNLHASLSDRNCTNAPRIDIQSSLTLHDAVHLQGRISLSIVIAKGRGTSSASCASQES
jgi:hypothetical protein